MHPSIKVIRDVLVYVKFENDGIEKVTRKHIEILGDDLTTVDYEQDDSVDKSAKAIEEAISEYQEQQESIKAMISESTSDDEVEEDED